MNVDPNKLNDQTDQTELVNIPTGERLTQEPPTQTKDLKLDSYATYLARPEALEKPREGAEKFAYDVHNHVWDNLSHAEQKAGFVFAIVASLLAYLHSRGITKAFLIPLPTWHIKETSSFIAVVFLVTAAFFVILVVRPRFRGRPDGIVYWAGISRHATSRDYSDRVLANSELELTREVLEHAHELSRIAASKYKYAGAAILAASIGSFAALILLGFLD